MKPSLISIILPVYNQADHVTTILGEYEKALDQITAPYELVLVVNGSNDNSLEICRGLETRGQNIRAFHEERSGWGRAVRRGIKESRGSLICYTNLARTSAEDLTLLLLYASVQDGVVVKATRKIRDSALRRIASLLYNLECRALFDLSHWDVNGTPKVFPRSFDELLTLTRGDDLIDLELAAVCRREGYPMLEVPIFSSRRHGGRSTTSYLSAARLYWGAVRFWWSWRSRTRPL